MNARVVLALALALGTAACAGAGGDKAGGEAEPAAHNVAKPIGKPITLTLVTVDETWATEFAAAAASLSGGTVRIRVRVGGNAIVDYERTLVGHVRSGRAELASVGARAWDRMGVTSFQGLVAPLLMDSFELQQRALAGAAARSTLAGVERLGLVGLALLPGTLRRPLGLVRPLLGPDDYSGATVGIRYGRVAQSTVEALGATAKAYRIGSLARLDGAELDPTTIRNNGYDARGSSLTANVVLWARPETIVIDRRVFTNLAPAHREVLRRAGREAAAAIRTKIEREQRDALAELCGRGALTLATASARDVAALRATVRPVMAALERDPATRGLIGEIERLKRTVPADKLSCEADGAGAGALRGRWTADGSAGMTLELGGGHWSARGQGRSWSGTYVVEGSRLRLVVEHCSHNPCEPGGTTVLRWSVYRDTLSLRPVSGRTLWPVEASWRRGA